MAVKRKSNWYIYFIAFGITMAFVIMAIMAFRWYLFPEPSESTGLEQNGDLSDDFRPGPEHSFNLLTMLSDGVYDSPDLFMLVCYNAVENSAAFIPLPHGVSVEYDGRTLPNVYAAQGGEGVLEAVRKVTGVSCDAYVKLDRMSFMSLVASFGNVDFDVAKTVVIRDGLVSQTIKSGDHFFTAEQLFGYIMLVEFGEGELYRFNCVGDILSELINQNFRNVDSSMLDAYYKLLTTDTDNNITESFFKSHKAALLNTVEYGNYPMEFYVPYGEYTDDGGFKIAQNSVNSIKQRAGIE